MKTRIAFSLMMAATLASPALAMDDPLNGADFVLNCISDQDGSAVTLARSGATDAGFIVTDKIRGESQILPGVNSLTFLHIMDTDVVTFVVDFGTLNYDMTVRGQHSLNDRGQCQDPV